MHIVRPLGSIDTFKKRPLFAAVVLGLTGLLAYKVLKKKK